MNTRLKTLMIAAIAVISIASCKKEIDWDAFPIPGNSSCTLSNLKMDTGFFVADVSFTYDASGRLSKSSNDGDATNYTYTSSKISISNAGTADIEINLANGRATSSTNPEAIEVNGVLHASEKVYTYNAEGYLSVVKTYLDGKLNSTDELTYTNGNLTKAVLTLDADGSVVTSIYEYSTQLAVNMEAMADATSFHVDYIPGNYFGNKSKNVLTKYTETKRNSNAEIATEDITNYVYQFDTKGNATSITLNTSSSIYQNGTIESTDNNSLKNTLTYSCK